MPGNPGLLVQKHVRVGHGEDGDPAQKMEPVLEIMWRMKSVMWRTAVRVQFALLDNIGVLIIPASWGTWESWSSCADPNSGEECKTSSRSRECVGGVTGVDCQGKGSQDNSCAGCCELKCYVCCFLRLSVSEKQEQP
jgi:hypothetical protein